MMKPDKLVQFLILLVVNFLIVSGINFLVAKAMTKNGEISFYSLLLKSLLLAVIKRKMSDSNQQIIPLLNKELSLELPEKLAMNELEQKLTTHINHLINTDFEKLIYYLYRIDVNETKMKQLLQEQNGEQAALLIARLIIDRQLQKLQTRQQFRQSNTESDEERW
ncbi:MAG: hypothetical protein GXC73_09440 [Chitinophagaceae bacterium]|nr:hypothetical protein [Chitinophagaceae bacterium]